MLSSGRWQVSGSRLFALGERGGVSWLWAIPTLSARRDPSVLSVRGLTQATGNQRVRRHAANLAAECRHEVSVLLDRAGDVAEVRFVVVACPRIQRVHALLVGGDCGKAPAPEMDHVAVSGEPQTALSHARLPWQRAACRGSDCHRWRRA